MLRTLLGMMETEVGFKIIYEKSCNKIVFYQKRGKKKKKTLPDAQYQKEMYAQVKIS